MRSRHNYASVTLLKEYLAGDGFTDAWTNDDNLLRRLGEAASLRIEEHVGERCFGPFLATREYDLGRGTLRRPANIDTNEGIPHGHGFAFFTNGVVGLGDWLTATPTTVTAYDGSARGSSTVLTEGLANDYILEPDGSGQNPFDTFKLSENTSNRLTSGQRTLSLIATWGFQDVTEDTGIITDSSVVTAIGDDHINIDSDSAISPGEVILVESEQVYVTSVAAHGAHQAAYGIRGVNGTAAAEHETSLPISRYTYPADVVEACLSIAKDLYRSRETGQSPFVGPTGAPAARPGTTIGITLKALDYYLKRRESSGVFF